MTDSSPIADDEQSLTIFDAEARPVVQIALLATVFFENGYEPDVREAVIDCFEEYCRMTGDRLRWTTHPKTHHWMPVTTLPGNTREWLLKVDRDEGWQLTYQGGASSEEASHYRFEALGTRAWESAHTLSYLQLCLPLTWYAD